MAHLVSEAHVAALLRRAREFLTTNESPNVATSVYGASYTQPMHAGVVSSRDRRVAPPATNANVVRLPASSRAGPFSRVAADIDAAAPASAPSAVTARAAAARILLDPESSDGQGQEALSAGAAGKSSYSIAALRRAASVGVPPEPVEDADEFDLRDRLGADAGANTQPAAQPGDAHNGQSTTDLYTPLYARQQFTPDHVRDAHHPSSAATHPHSAPPVAPPGMTQLAPAIASSPPAAPMDAARSHTPPRPERLAPTPRATATPPHIISAPSAASSVVPAHSVRPPTASFTLQRTITEATEETTSSVEDDRSTPVSRPRPAAPAPPNVSTLEWIRMLFESIGAGQRPTPIPVVQLYGVVRLLAEVHDVIMPPLVTIDDIAAVCALHAIACCPDLPEDGGWLGILIDLPTQLAINDTRARLRAIVSQDVTPPRGHAVPLRSSFATTASGWTDITSISRAWEARQTNVRSLKQSSRAATPARRVPHRSTLLTQGYHRSTSAPPQSRMLSQRTNMPAQRRAAVVSPPPPARRSPHLTSFRPYYIPAVLTYRAFVDVLHDIALLRLSPVQVVPRFAPPVRSHELIHQLLTEFILPALLQVRH